RPFESGGIKPHVLISGIRGRIFHFDKTFRTLVFQPNKMYVSHPELIIGDSFLCLIDILTMEKPPFL
ncbi:MAG TPA: hypothetical protein VMW90_04405, partial [Acidobacteriota bacterium]|nr:hypothetical protein [Acidobacteriota bacterium]